ncbi:MAG: Tyrosine-tRNA ligase [Microgenomates group bacterium GW2011_GWA2_39_19]|uniref:Tyrosine--tRNA ligase n=1 Tax=Candidatus Blackburnbacteria bacterium RIFCSPLOWO2_01_FULL_40_20 TaxID=1797519 RepID=A0A1G1VF83_9BACT|nr:MAG: Tyrosine-tRNA ligase [Microgenomates group bacterium GW2011_GWA2_39_19]OGY14029.1 MAG: tyrosine--tRNA ligase [Candidatus Blackburnbacteria bacterium RIFCSPLOWO2_01_FULL_40_20]
MTTEEILTRRTANVLPDKEGLTKLMSGKKIRVYQGFDPTGPSLHLGHSIGIRKLMDFANAGHEVIVLFGTGTVLAGDPSQRDKARRKIDPEQIEKNISTWKEQVKSLIDFDKVQIKYNGEWLLKLNLADIVNIASNISATQLFKRDMFQRRIEREDTVWTHELLYPLLQGYDSVAMDVDLEVGGTDQEFNMLIGRELQRKMNNREKFVLTVPMINGTDGKPMSKTSGNCVWLNDTPEDMYGKLMSIPDNQIIPYMELVTDLPVSEVHETEERLKSGSENPMNAKKRLAFAVVEQLHSKEAAGEAQEEFENVFQKKEAPENVEIFQIKEAVNITDVITNSGLAQSKSEARRLVEQGGVEWEGEKVSNLSTLIDKSGLLKVGKYRFLKIERI